MIPCKSSLNFYEKSLEAIDKRKLVSDELFPKIESISNAIALDRFIQKRQIEKFPCFNCQYYYGKDSIVCAVHPSGSDSTNCPDKVFTSDF